MKGSLRELCPRVNSSDFAVQLTAGLEAAHARGIVHRDLKPGNLRITEGRFKILDFGLATLVQPVGDGANTVTMTAAGTVAGTVPYMAPEQLRGEAADARSDIHAAGAVLYEMATGRRAFSADGGPQIIAAILQGMSPTPSSINPRVTGPGSDHLEVSGQRAGASLSDGARGPGAAHLGNRA